LLDSLLKDMPVRPETLLNAKKSILNSINNYYPSFRYIAANIASDKRLGYNESPYNALLNALDNMDMDTVIDFYNRNIKGNITCYVLPGILNRLILRNCNSLGRLGG